MKKNAIFLFFCFFLTTLGLRAQLSANSYAIIEKDQNFNLDFFNELDLPMLDLYRAESVDNIVLINQNGNVIKLTLFSAVKCRQLAIAFDEEMKDKGEVMGTRPNAVSTFKFEVSPDNKLIDLTTY